MKKLKILDMCSNKIEKLDGIENLVSLEDFWLSENNVADWANVEEKLKYVSKTLRVIYMEHNPIVIKLCFCDGNLIFDLGWADWLFDRNKEIATKSYRN